MWNSKGEEMRNTKKYFLKFIITIGKFALEYKSWNYLLFLQIISKANFQDGLFQFSSFLRKLLRLLTCDGAHSSISTETNYNSCNFSLWKWTSWHSCPNPCENSLTPRPGFFVFSLPFVLSSFEIWPSKNGNWRTRQTKNLIASDLPRATDSAFKSHTNTVFLSRKLEPLTISFSGFLKSFQVGKRSGQ